jgi:hypothetical protein
MDSIKRFYCCSTDLCQFRNEWASNRRCFAPYPIRTSCPSLMRSDGKSWKEGSKETDEFVREES